LKTFIIYPKVRQHVVTVKYYAIGLYERFSSEHLLINGASLAFSILICLIPWSLLLFSAFGFFLSTEESMTAVEENINQFIPLPGYEAEVQREIHSRLDDLVNYRQTAGLIGIVGVLWLSTFLFGTARTILNQIFKVKIQKNIFIDKLRDLRVLLIMGVLFLLALFGSTFVYVVRQFIANHMVYLEQLHIPGTLPVIVGFILTWSMFFILYRFIPYLKLQFDVLLVSATVSAILWEVAKYLFGLYISNFANITRIYGALTVFAGTALWLYYSSIVFLLGAVMGQLYRERKQLLKHL
jgi:membrane protein